MHLISLKCGLHITVPSAWDVDAKKKDLLLFGWVPHSEWKT